MPEELEPLIFVDSKIQKSRQAVHISPAAHNSCGILDENFPGNESFVFVNEAHYHKVGV